MEKEPTICPTKYARGYETSQTIKRTGSAGASGSLNKWAYLEDALNRKIDTTT